MHSRCHCLSKTFYFPYLNMLIFSQLSFRATWYPNAAKSQFLSVFLCVFLSVLKHRYKWNSTVFFPPGFLCDWACCNICSSWGLYVFTGITQPAQTLPSERLSHTHTPPTHTHTGQHIKLLLSNLAGLYCIWELHFTTTSYSLVCDYK